jgi:hypothetical protein
MQGRAAGGDQRRSEGAFSLKFTAAAPPINCIDNAVETGTLLSAFLRLFHIEQRCYRFNENGPALGSRAASNAD